MGLQLSYWLPVSDHDKPRYCLLGCGPEDYLPQQFNILDGDHSTGPHQHKVFGDEAQGLA